MKVAEALVLRADCQRKMAQIKMRLERVVKVQEGEQPAENPDLLLDELLHTIEELTGWIKKINRTNALTSFNETLSVADALAERDKLMQKRNALQEVLEYAAIKQDRFSRPEIKFYRTVDVAVIQKQVDELSKAYRELDFKIQEMNWTTDLVE